MERKLNEDINKASINFPIGGHGHMIMYRNGLGAKICKVRLVRMYIENSNYAEGLHK